MLEHENINKLRAQLCNAPYCSFKINYENVMVLRENIIITFKHVFDDIIQRLKYKSSIMTNIFIHFYNECVLEHDTNLHKQKTSMTHPLGFEKLLFNAKL